MSNPSLCKQCGAQWYIRTHDEDLCAPCGAEKTIADEGYSVEEQADFTWAVFHGGGYLRGGYYDKADAVTFAVEYIDGYRPEVED